MNVLLSSTARMYACSVEWGTLQRPLPCAAIATAGKSLPLLPLHQGDATWCCTAHDFEYLVAIHAHYATAVVPARPQGACQQALFHPGLRVQRVTNLSSRRQSSAKAA